MPVVVKEVRNKKMLRAFIDLPYRLYRQHPCFIPPLRPDEESTLRPDKNPAFDHCEARYWLAFQDNRVVGRIAAILNKAFIQKWGKRYIRFGWFDVEDNSAVAAALVQKVEEWGQQLGMDAVHGPLGFTDLDHEGLLVDGFDQRGTLASPYNFAYYPTLLEASGYGKDVDWVEYKFNLPQIIDPRLTRIAAAVQQRLELRTVPLKKGRDLKPYVPAIFDLINSAYGELYGVVPLTPRQIAYYTRQYFSFMRPDFVSLVLDKQDRLAAFGITMPSLSLALQKAGGRLFPFGFIHLLKALKQNQTADLLLIAVRKDLQGKGVNALLMEQLLGSYIRHGIRQAEASHQLENNRNVQALWDLFDARVHRRRRCYIKYLTNNPPS